MITSFNPENKEQYELYSRLFKEAYDLLASKNKLSDLEISLGKFTSLDQYFSHMNDLREENVKYLMLPLDNSSEGIFVINANDRSITIPT